VIIGNNDRSGEDRRPMIEDELLKWRFKRGSREALAGIYEKYVHLLLSVAMGLLNDPHEAEDVV
jgi:DNA-directed RNA polymerase specialized sigma24 family protein